MRKYNQWNSTGNRPFKSFKAPFNPFTINPADYDPGKVNNSEALLASFTGNVVEARPGEDIESLMRRFKKVVESSGILAELKKREYYRGPSLKKKEKAIRAQKRAKKAKYQD